MFFIVFIALFSFILFKQMYQDFKTCYFELIILILLSLIIWTRYGFGTDYFSYDYMYYRIQTGSLNDLLKYYQNIGIGFKLIIYFFKSFNLSFYIFASVLNSVTLLFFFLWIKDNSKDTVVSFFLFYSMFFLVWVLSAFRQGLVMAISLYSLFNERYTLKFGVEIFIILLLSLIHPSALIFLVFKILDRIEWNRNKHVFFLVGSLIFTFIPISTIIQTFPNFPFYSMIKSYLSADVVKFYDFPGLLRLSLAVFILYFYDKFDNIEREEYADRFLYGVSLYFIFKFSELTAARLTVYTFIIIVILIPAVISKTKLSRALAISFTLIFGFFYFDKEMDAMFLQSKYMGNKNYLGYETIFNKDSEQFSSDQRFLSYVKDLASESMDEYKKNMKNRQLVQYNEKDEYIVVKQKGKYILINQRGDILENYQFSLKPELIGNVIIEQYYSKGYFFTSKRYIDLTDKNRTQVELKQYVSQYYKEEIDFTYKEKRLSVELEEIHPYIRSFVPDQKQIQNVTVNKIYAPFEYYIFRIRTPKNKFYLYFDSEMNLLTKNPVRKAYRYDKNEIVMLETFYHSSIYMNKDGEIIWWNAMEQ